MFHEFLWYKEVKGMLSPQYRDVKNEAGKSPQELFTENHEKLVLEVGGCICSTLVLIHWWCMHIYCLWNDERNTSIRDTLTIAILSNSNSSWMQIIVLKQRLYRLEENHLEIVPSLCSHFRLQLL
ncbi:hypothetical protein HanHA300_Chr15g0566901 [Helianthus annuus]|nr:hypothetical protein HanHA300_Chr15g0566901 [Helianthus annuus]KAJ0473255.1 hypothetical protein HanHA89_Chr15g0616241 [Helianthus annuus]KAJ0652650.1 hypothetical protein HanOQP8_Chr15g0574531 [Helianthus annuus]